MLKIDEKTAILDEIVTSLVDFLNVLQKTRNASGLTVYRGHADEAYKIKPSLFRSQKLKERENELLKEIEAKRPDYFSPSMTTLEKLVLLQHYHLPTRLLDVSLNPLVALYFAVCSHPEKNAEVLVFDVDASKSFDSDTVSCFANLAQLGANDKSSIDKLIQEREDKLAEYREVYEKITSKTFYDYINNRHDEILERLSHGENQVPKFLDDDLEFNFVLNFIYFYDYLSRNTIEEKIIEEKIQAILHLGNLTLEEEIRKTKYSYYYEIDRREKKSFNSNPAIQRLIHAIRSEKSFFQPNINPDDFRKVIYVKAKQSNPRIIAQDGAFFIFGMNETMENIPKKRIKIAASSKKRIMEELDIIGFNEHKLFPELEYFAKDLLKKYTV